MMQFYPKTVLGFFDSSQKTYEIPVYQRAYSWETKNWQTFLDDLHEQIEGDNNYFFGNVLLEIVTKDKFYEIIDGQQRITTLTIFMRAVLNVLEQRNDLPEGFKCAEKAKLFLQHDGNKKLRPVEYDRPCYDAIIIDNKDFSVSTPSQKRIKDAKEFFEKKLTELSTTDILKILDKIESTELTIIELSGKKDSALIFELENNRGKELSNMEKIKSYFMYQMYVYSAQENVEANINGVSEIFKQIYLKINELQINEDSVLIYNNNAYINGFNYRNLDDVKRKFKDAEGDKTEWIKSYVRELHHTFSNLVIFEGSKDVFAQNLFQLGIPAFAYPFIIKGYKYIYEQNQDENQRILLLHELFHVIEKLVFRQKLINSRANMEDRLHGILNSFTGDVTDLSAKLKTKLNEAWYWGDKNTANYLNGIMYGNKVLNYLLWRYEDHIQKNRGYQINVSMNEEQIEHISPQTPTNGDPISTGYDVDSAHKYSESFITDQLNCVGNLMLISGIHNRVIGNIPFTKKLESYRQSHLTQQQEIDSFAQIENGEKVWKRDSIIDRQRKIVDFAIQAWSF